MPLTQLMLIKSKYRDGQTDTGSIEKHPLFIEKKKHTMESKLSM